MTKKHDDSYDYDLFITEFPKQGYGIVDYLQGRVHFALLDQMKLMNTSGMTKSQIKEAILENIIEIIDNFDPNVKSKEN